MLNYKWKCKCSGTLYPCGGQDTLEVALSQIWTYTGTHQEARSGAVAAIMITLEYFIFI